MNLISDIMFWISTGLLVPVMVLLVALFFRALLLLGAFFGQYMSMRKNQKAIKNEMDALTVDNIDALAMKLPVVKDSLMLSYMHEMLKVKDSEAQIKRLLSNFEIAADKDLASSKTLTKLGPILGLMGTLIPMGPALVGLSTGDIGSMAYNMQVAFATTVIGLFAGAIGFITQQVKQRWFLQDMVNLDFLSELLIEKKNS